MKYLKVLFITLIVCIFEMPIFCIAHTGIGYNNLFISSCIIYAYCIIGLGLIYVINKLHMHDIKVYNATICTNGYKSIQRNLFNDLSNLNFWCKIEYILHSRFTEQSCNKLCNKLNDSNAIVIYHALKVNDTYTTFGYDLFGTLKYMNIIDQLKFLWYSRFSEKSCDKLCDKLNKHGIF